jgi:hypothetical protein
MNRELRNFLTTPNLEVAWGCYQDWYDFQVRIGRTNEVGFSGCEMNNKIYWRVLVTQDLHDARIPFMVDDLTSRRWSEDSASLEQQEEQEQLLLPSLRTVMLLLTMLL